MQSFYATQCSLYIMIICRFAFSIVVARISYVAGIASARGWPPTAGSSTTRSKGMWPLACEGTCRRQRQRHTETQRHTHKYL